MNELPADVGALVEHWRPAFLTFPDVASRDYSHVEALTYCASPIAPSLLRQCLETFPVPIVQGYGMTECSPTISILGDREHRDTGNPHRLASAGKPIPGTEVQLADLASGQPVGAGHVGEVLVRSRQVMLGCWDGTGPDSFGKVAKDELRERAMASESAA
jgi:acyl-CoA synthetase (AMP-forming)/AMP-acid ligase II